MITIVKLVKNNVLNDGIYIFMIILGIANMICTIISTVQKAGLQIFCINANAFLLATLGGFFFPIIVMCLAFDIIALIIRISKN